jgi:hypothetical protein
MPVDCNFRRRNEEQGCNEEKLDVERPTVEVHRGKEGQGRWSGEQLKRQDG